MFTLDYAALTYGGTPETSLYVKREGKILGAVIRDHEGNWTAFDVADLLDLRNPLARNLTKDDAIATVIADTSA
jgi:hypothetical protein